MPSKDIANTPKHIFIITPNLWGHTRPTFTLAERVIHARPNTFITILVSTKLYDRAVAECSRCFWVEEASLRKMVRVVALPEEDLNTAREGFLESCTTIYQNLQNLQPIICAKTGQVFKAIRSPSAIIRDYLLWNVFEALRNIRDTNVQILSSFSCSASAIFHHHGPPRLSGRPDPRPQINKEMQKLSETLEVVANRVGL